MKKFLERDDLPSATSTKLLQVLDDPAKTRKLKIEIPTTVDAMEPFVQATYKLEGDGPLVLRLTSSSVYFLPPCLPSITQMLLLWQRLKQMEMLHKSNSSLTIQRHVYSLYTIILLKFNNDIEPVLEAFKAAAFPFLSSQETIDGLKMEILMYMAASEDVSTEIDLIAWWKRHAIELPKWANVFKKVLLVQPSSVAAERGFFQFYKDILRNSSHLWKTT